MKIDEGVLTLWAITFVSAISPIIGLKSLITVGAWLWIDVIIWGVFIPLYVGERLLKLLLNLNPTRGCFKDNKDSHGHYGFFSQYFAGLLVSLPVLGIIFFLASSKIFYI